MMTILESLKTLRDAVNGKEYDPSFTYRPGVGICWHVYSHASTEVYHELNDVFLSMGLDDTYPVESQFYSAEFAQVQAYNMDSDKYNPDTVLGHHRLKLLDDLIEHFTEKSTCITPGL